MSFVLDDLGIYFEAQSQSRLERLIAQTKLDAAARARAESLCTFINANRLSKYNLPPIPVRLPPRKGKRIVLVDQTARDASISGALAGSRDFERMIELARRAHSGAELILATHPDTAAGCARGALGSSRGGGDIFIVPGGGCPHTLLDEADEVWTVSSQLGFEALMRNIPVTTFGVPFYAGWGLTRDLAEGEQAQAALLRRSAFRPSLADLVHAALIQYPLYLDPVVQRLATAEAVAERLVVWRDEARRIGRSRICVGFATWKRPQARAYLDVSGGASVFVRPSQALDIAGPADNVVIWGMKAGDELAANLRAKGALVSRLEDGFLRSSGLGSDFLFPWSLCLDEGGIYFDASSASDLEALINSGPPPPHMLARAAALRQNIVSLGVSKYNLEGGPPQDLREMAAGRRILLVIGQVPGDFSLRLGNVVPSGNLDFLARVRAQNSSAYIIYKEHPDLVAGNSRGRSDFKKVRALADMVVTHGDAARWIAACDHVHVMTSLAGFEALLRDKPVTCWGAPFYAGWGLTDDLVVLHRRTYRPTIDELVCRVFLNYSMYRIRGVHVPVVAEELLQYISKTPYAARRGTQGNGARHWIRRAFRYTFAQITSLVSERTPTKLHFIARAGWPFFR